MSRRKGHHQLFVCKTPTQNETKMDWLFWFLQKQQPVAASMTFTRVLWRKSSGLWFFPSFCNFHIPRHLQYYRCLLHWVKPHGTCFSWLSFTDFLIHGDRQQAGKHGVHFGLSTGTGFQRACRVSILGVNSKASGHGLGQPLELD